MKTFDSRANGYIRSEGVGALVLEAGDGAHALHSILVRQDGRSASLTAPNGLAQRALLLAALGRSRGAAEAFCEAAEEKARVKIREQVPPAPCSLHPALQVHPRARPLQRPHERPPTLPRSVHPPARLPAPERPGTAGPLAPAAAPEAPPLAREVAGGRVRVLERVLPTASSHTYSAITVSDSATFCATC